MCCRTILCDLCFQGRPPSSIGLSAGRKVWRSKRMPIPTSSLPCMARRSSRAICALLAPWRVRLRYRRRALLRALISMIGKWPAHWGLFGPPVVASGFRRFRGLQRFLRAPAKMQRRLPFMSAVFAASSSREHGRARSNASWSEELESPFRSPRIRLPAD